MVGISPELPNLLFQEGQIGLFSFGGSGIRAGGEGFTHLIFEKDLRMRRAGVALLFAVVATLAVWLTIPGRSGAG